MQFVASNAWLVYPISHLSHQHSVRDASLRKYCGLLTLEENALAIQIRQFPLIWARFVGVNC